MDKLLVLVNGLPGSGKSTLGRSLALTLNAQLLSKDTVKEALAGCLDDAADLRALGGIAMDTVWALAQAIPGIVVIDSWWFKPRDLHFARTGIRNTGASRAVELWCDVPSSTAKARYAARNRPALYHDEAAARRRLGRMGDARRTTRTHSHPCRRHHRFGRLLQTGRTNPNHSQSDRNRTPACRLSVMSHLRCLMRHADSGEHQL